MLKLTPEGRPREEDNPRGLSHTLVVSEVICIRHSELGHLTTTRLVHNPMATQSEIAEIPTSVSIATPSLRKNFGWTFSGNFTYALCQWGMLSVLAKLGNPSVVGQYAIALAICHPIFMLTNLQLRTVQATDARSEYEFADYFSLRCLGSTFGIFLVLSTTIFVGYNRTTALVVVLVAAWKFIESISNVITGQFQKSERLDQSAIGLMIRGAVSILAFGVAYWWVRNLVAGVLSAVVVSAIAVVCYDVQRVRRLLRRGQESRRFFRLRWPTLRRLTILSFPLGVVMALISLNSNLPRYVLERKLGSAELGIFASLAYLVIAASLIVNALGQSATARLSRMFVTGRFGEFRAVMRKLLLFGVVIVAVGTPLAAAFGKPLIAILYRPEYAARFSVFLVLVVTVGIGAMASFLGYGVTAARVFKPQVAINGACALTTLIVTLVLVPRHGIMGAAIALLAAAVVQTMLNAFVLKMALNSAACCLPSANVNDYRAKQEIL